MKKSLFIIALLWLVVLAWCESKDTKEDTESTASIYSIQDVAKHATETTCRSIVRSKVYDFTTRAWQHPWGSGKILAICGTDASPIFEKVHWGKEKPEMKLEQFYIWDLKE
jgi:cytochrome b involved in lipid metabolism